MEDKLNSFQKASRVAIRPRFKSNIPLRNKVNEFLGPQMIYPPN